MSNPSSDQLILCIDDDPEIRELLSGLIRSAGFGALAASSADEALQLLEKEQNRTVLVIADYQMPGMNGLELRKKMLDQWKNIPYIVLSGHITREMALLAVEYKIAAICEKPYKEDEFKKLIIKESSERATQLAEETELLNGFVSDAGNLIDELEPLILSLEAQPNDVETLNRVFAIAHTIKGSSGFFKPDYVHRFTHKFEDYLSAFKNGGATFTPHSINILLKGLDVIKSLLASLGARSNETHDIASLCKIFENQPVQGTAEAPTSPQTATAASPQTSHSAASSEIKISLAVMDQFMELSGEITVVRNMIIKLARTIEKEVAGNKNITYLSELLEHLHKINSQMQDKVVDLRKIPLKEVFRPLPRTLRELTQSLKKTITLEFAGDELRIDHTLAEALKSCLVHMVRNAADHGIELPAERQKSGKTPNGTLKISCKEKQDEIIISIADDGKGINPEIVKRKLLEKGLRTEEQIQRMSVSEIQAMIFEPGFSTASVVTDVSGRGVGMDMVMKTVDRVGGKIEIVSEVGKGTEIIMKLPIPKSVVITTSLMVKCAGDTFAIPQEDIVRLLCLNPTEMKKQLRTVSGASLLDIDGTLLPLISLKTLLQMPTSLNEEPKYTIIVIAKAGGALIGLQIDEILDIEDTVVKRLASVFKEDIFFSGATFLGDGRVALILDLRSIAIASRVKGVDSEKAPRLNSANQTAYTDEIDLLLFSIGTSSTMGVRLEDIFRLEDFQPTQIKVVGDQPVVIYRRTTMPIYSLGALSGLSPNAQVLNSTQLPTLVTKNHAGHFVGLAVSEIIDLIRTPLSSDQFIPPGGEDFLESHIIGEKTVTLVNIKVLLQRTESYHAQKHAA